MNLRVTPSFNTIQPQNHKQNPNFGLRHKSIGCIRCGVKTAQLIALNARGTTEVVGLGSVQY